VKVLAILVWGDAFVLQSYHHEMQTSRTDPRTVLCHT